MFLLSHLYTLHHIPTYHIWIYILYHAFLLCGLYLLVPPVHLLRSCHSWNELECHIFCKCSSCSHLVLHCREQLCELCRWFCCFCCYFLFLEHQSSVSFCWLPNQGICMLTEPSIFLFVLLPVVVGWSRCFWPCVIVCWWCCICWIWHSGCPTADTEWCEWAFCRLWLPGFHHFEVLPNCLKKA